MRSYRYTDPAYTNYWCEGSPWSCPYLYYSNGGGGASGTVADDTPIISNISPTIWPAGLTTQVTITGQHFETNVPSLSFSIPGVQSQGITSHSDTQVVVSVYVTPNTPIENVSVQLTSTGYNRFGDSLFPGGSVSTWHAVLIPAQFYGASNTTPNGVAPELGYAAAVYNGTSTVSIPAGCKAYWSPTAAQYATLHGWASKQAGQISDASWPGSVGAPKLWLGQPKQAVIKTSIGNNLRGGTYQGAPAFVLFQLAPSATAPEVITIL